MEGTTAATRRCTHHPTTHLLPPPAETSASQADLSGKIGPASPVPRVGSAPDTTLLLGSQPRSSSPGPAGNSGQVQEEEDPRKFAFYNIKRYRTYFNVDTSVGSRGGRRAWRRGCVTRRGMERSWRRLGRSVQGREVWNAVHCKRFAHIVQVFRLPPPATSSGPAVTRHAGPRCALPCLPQEVLNRIFWAVVLFFKSDFLDNIDGNPDLWVQRLRRRSLALE